ncbi:30S ribosomal protein S9 [Candidatus Neptunochlamydia vexilliferae]|uniref:Small ribosomal subunit protein uS9 n=1 Tax=Candidatus Neptunichlamydia vexilliferae TaxID=1651774 RepID=A0ABS0AZF9_9BACT|nr:30S ribosomal protein S9 [Candidatus Neptunochlamydia vexilliferae]MBF5059519.1 30S ribosomal protein S9 [Candidatus Neptunochlamydia vexilliferae]
MATKKINELIGVGRRKTAIASVRLRKGKGNIDVNGRTLEEYFTTPLQRETILSPLKKLELEGNYDIIIRAKGGGIEGQMIAARLGIARALVQEDEERRGSLKGEGFLTRDPRKRERQKCGQPGARKKFQFSKR